jgi:nitrite reductase/ring-hydroxylating ferredoxin subunit
MQSYFLCHQHEIIENQPRDFDIDIETLHDINSVVLLRHDNQLYCYQNRCPHLGIPLNWQPDDFLSIEKTHIQCSTHGALFNFTDGQCIMGPCNGDQLTPLTIECDEDDKIWLKVI